MEEVDRLAVGREAQPEKGHLEDAVSIAGGLRRRGDTEPGDVGGAPLEEDEGRRARAAVADAAPEPDEVLPAVEGLVESREGGTATEGRGG